MWNVDYILTMKTVFFVIFQPIPANKIAVEPNEYFWHLSHYENRIQDTQIDLQLTGFVVWVTGSYQLNLLCEKKMTFLLKMTLKSKTKRDIDTL